MNTTKYVITALLFLACFPAAGADSGGDSYRQGLLVEQASSPLKSQKDYDVALLVYRFTFLLNDQWEFNVEPCVGVSFSPTDSYELGIPLLLRFKQWVSDDWLLFVDGGAGPVWVGVSTYEQSTEFNFIDLIGVGVGYRWDRGVIFEAGSRIRHVSNAGLGEGNSGINGVVLYAGLTFGF